MTAEEVHRGAEGACAEGSRQSLEPSLAFETPESGNVPNARMPARGGVRAPPDLVIRSPGPPVKRDFGFSEFYITARLISIGERVLHSTACASRARTRRRSRRFERRGLPVA